MNLESDSLFSAHQFTATLVASMDSTNLNYRLAPLGICLKWLTLTSANFAEFQIKCRKKNIVLSDKNRGISRISGTFRKSRGWKSRNTKKMRISGIKIPKLEKSQYSGMKILWAKNTVKPGKSRLLGIWFRNFRDFPLEIFFGILKFLSRSPVFRIFYLAQNKKKLEFEIRRNQLWSKGLKHWLWVFEQIKNIFEKWKGENLNSNDFLWWQFLINVCWFFLYSD